MPDNTIAKGVAEISANLGPFNRSMNLMEGRLKGLANRKIDLFSYEGFFGFSRIKDVFQSFAGLQHSAALLQDTSNKARVVFGENFGMIGKYADDLADKFGLVKSKAMDAMANFGQQAEGIGLKGKDVAEFSKTFVKLAADLKSYQGGTLKTMDDAMGMINSALAGETEPLRRLGIDVSDNTVKQYALARGFTASWAAMDHNQKTMIRANLIIEKMAKITGDLDRTQNDLQNSTDAAGGRFENLVAKIGMELIPAFQSYQNLVNQILADLTASVDGQKSKLTEFSDFVKGVVADIGIVWRNWGLIVERTGVMIGGWAVNVQEALKWVWSVAVAVKDAFVNDWQRALLGVFDAILTALINLGQNMRNIFMAAYETIASGFQKEFKFEVVPIMKGFNAADHGFKIPKLDLSNVDGQLKEIDDKMAANENKNLNGAQKKKLAANQNRFALPPGSKGEGKGEKPEFFALDEFRKQILAPKKDDKNIAETATNTRQMAVGIRDMNHFINKMKAGPGYAVGPK